MRRMSKEKQIILLLFLHFYIRLLFVIGKFMRNFFQQFSLRIVSPPFPLNQGKGVTACDWNRTNYNAKEKKPSAAQRSSNSMKAKPGGRWATQILRTFPKRLNAASS